MESTNRTDSYEDNRDTGQSRQSLQSTKKYSRESSVQSHKKNTRHVIQDEGVRSRSKMQTWHSDPDRDRVSDREERRSSRSFYSDDYENNSCSEDSVSSYSRSRTPSPSLQRQRRAKGVSSNPTLKTGIADVCSDEGKKIAFMSRWWQCRTDFSMATSAHKLKHS